MGELAEEIDGLPSICGSEQRIEEAIRAGHRSGLPAAGGHRVRRRDQRLRRRLAHAPAAHPGRRA